MWPIQRSDNSTAQFEGWTLWMVLSAPVLPDPDQRHGIARIRLIGERAGEWRDCGNLLPDGLNPGSREWAGSAIYDPETSMVTLFYTVAGYRGEEPQTFAQRLFQTSGTLEFSDGNARVCDWSIPVESVASDDDWYVLVNQSEGRPGFIKGFRDPAYFRDPADGAVYLLFTGSLKNSESAWNGVIGLAKANVASLTSWELLPPVLAADGLNNEQERPHVIYRDGLYYLFWSTQRHVFAPDGPSGPNGLYGMVAPSVLGPYEPLNGTGLVAANPPKAPFQTYSWWVNSDLEVAGFVDLVGLDGKSAVDEPAWRRAHFGGVPAPRFRIELDGSNACVAKD
jgi:levansucrase